MLPISEDTKKEKKRNTAKKKEEHLSDYEWKQLMGQYMPVYRKTSGAIKRRGT